MTSKPALVILGAVSACTPMPDMLRGFVATTGGGCRVMHVEDAIADRLRAEAVDDVDLVPLIDPRFRLEPERVWSAEANSALQRLVEVDRTPAAVVTYPHREYDPVATFPSLKLACMVGGVPIVDGRTGKLVRRGRNDRLRELQGSARKALLASILESVGKTDKRKAS